MKRMERKAHAAFGETGFGKTGRHAMFVLEMTRLDSQFKSIWINSLHVNWFKSIRFAKCWPCDIFAMPCRAITAHVVILCLFVCLSVCLSVCHKPVLYRTAKRRITQTVPYTSPQQCSYSIPDFIQIGSLLAELEEPMSTDFWHRRVFP